MAISYPLTLPTHTGFRTAELTPTTVVGLARSQFTGSQQVYPWPGQWWTWAVTLPPMSQADASIWQAWFLSLNGAEGTFYLGPVIRKTTGGTASGTWLVGASAVANSTTLPIKSGSGLFAVGDWLQVGTGSSSRLHRVTQVNGDPMTSVDVFPRLRSAYAEDTAISFTNPVGLFRLAGLPSEAYDQASLAQGMSFNCFESL